jgi:hypothetical protein
MRKFIQFDAEGRVTGQLESLRVPGYGPDIPDDFVEVTDRTDGPWEGKIYDRATDTFKEKGQT